MKKKTKTIVNYILQRMKEPSTAASVAALFVLFGVPVQNEWISAGSQVLGAIASIAGILLSEHK